MLSLVGRKTFTQPVSRTSLVDSDLCRFMICAHYKCVYVCCLSDVVVAQPCTGPRAVMCRDLFVGFGII